MSWVPRWSVNSLFNATIIKVVSLTQDHGSLADSSKFRHWEWKIGGCRFCLYRCFFHSEKRKHVFFLFNLPLFSWTFLKTFCSLKFCTFIKYILILLNHHYLLTFFSASYPVFSHISCHHVVSFVAIDNHLSQISVVSMGMEWGRSPKNGQPIRTRSPKESDFLLIWKPSILYSYSVKNRALEGPLPFKLPFWLS